MFTIFSVFFRPFKIEKIAKIAKNSGKIAILIFSRTENPPKSLQTTSAIIGDRFYVLFIF